MRTRLVIFPVVRDSDLFSLGSSRFRGFFTSIAGESMATPFKLGWHSFKFDYGRTTFSIPLLLTDEQREVIELTKSLHRHAEELISGGYRANFDPDQLDQQ